MTLCLVLLTCCMPTVASAQLSQLVSTNTQCRVRLQPPWTGETRETVITNFPGLTIPIGSHPYQRERLARRASAELEKLQRELHFDWFTYSEKPHFIPSTRRISKSCGDKGETFFHSYRPSFPTDAQIAAVTNFSSLTSLLGATRGHMSAWGFDGETHTAASWALFTLKDEQTVETLAVYCRLVQARGQAERQLESIKVRRGIAKQQVR